MLIKHRRQVHEPQIKCDYKHSAAIEPVIGQLPFLPTPQVTRSTPCLPLSIATSTASSPG
jgi:hypothetical protein